MSEWRTVELGDVLTLQRGFDITKADQRPGTIPVVSSGGIGSYHDTAMVNGPGVVIGRKGTLGKVFYLPHDFWPHDTTLWVKDFKGNQPRFVYYFLRTIDFLSMNVGSSNPTLNRNHVHPIKVLWPDLRTQRSISRLLGALDDKIAVNDRIAATYEDILRLRFAALAIDVEPSPQDGIAASDLVDFNPRYRPPRTDDAAYLEMAALPTRTGRVQRWTRRPPKSGTRFANGDTVMARITPCLENGKTAFIDFLDEGEVGVGSTEFIVMRARGDVPPHVSYFLARSPRFREHAIRNMVGSSGRQRVAAASLTEFPLSRPRLPEMARFGELASSSFAHMKSLDAESLRLTRLRDTLLPKLMSGQVRLRDAEAAIEAAV